MDIERITEADPIDAADYYIESVIDDHVKEAMRKCAEMPKGHPGDCDICGEYFSRLVDNVCGFCRDKYGIK